MELSRTGRYIARYLARALPLVAKDAFLRFFFHSFEWGNEGGEGLAPPTSLQRAMEIEKRYIRPGNIPKCPKELDQS